MSEPTRDELCSRYLEQLPYEPYPVQEEALLAWFTSEQGVLVCAPTGTGKTLIAEAACFEALHTRKVCYYTTPLIALTEQKFQEMQEAAVRWGFEADDVGLVTGNRCVNPDARVLVVVAEILLNRLLHPTAFDFADTFAVVMDEFHSFNDPERGVVWELSLTQMPPHVRMLLLSATVGNASEFLGWLRSAHDRRLQLVQGHERKVPLRYEWVGDRLLSEHIEWMSEGEDELRRTPTLLFCFNRDQCWDVAEQLKGKHLTDKSRRNQLLEEIERESWNRGVAPKLKQILLRGVGVHHAGLLPRYRRIVEHLFQRKLLSVCVCTETLAAGINLPARSVVLTTLLKGPPGRKKVVDSSSGHQMFGRAGRPQFDREGYVYALAHEDDVKILRFQERLDQIPEDTRDPKLLAARKKLKKKAPTRRANEQYWSESQFTKLIESPPGKLSSRGHLPWRLLAYLLTLSPDVEQLRTFVDKRLLHGKQLENARKQLDRMLKTLWAGGYVDLEPEPPWERQTFERKETGSTEDADTDSGGLLGSLIQEARESGSAGTSGTERSDKRNERAKGNGERIADEENGDGDDDRFYQPRFARPTKSLADLLVFRSVNPLYGVYLVRELSRASFEERLQAWESVLEMPGSVIRHVRVPPPEIMPPGPHATTRLDDELIARGLATQQELYPPSREERRYDDEPRFAIPYGDKLRMAFNAEFPGVHSLRTAAVWAAGDLLRFGGDFDAFVSGRKLAKQEGVLFRHLLRLVLLCGEFGQLSPPDADPIEWHGQLQHVAETLTKSCRAVDPESTDKTLEAAEQAAATDVVDVPQRSTPHVPANMSTTAPAERDDFDSGLDFA